MDIDGFKNYSIERLRIMNIRLPPVKHLEHEIFCQGIKNIDLETMQIVLVKLHMMYLQEQALLNEIVNNNLLKSL